MSFLYFRPAVSAAGIPFRDIDRCLVHGECLRDIVQFQIVAYDFVQCIFSFENAVDLGNQNIDIIRLTDVIIRADLQAF